VGAVASQAPYSTATTVGVATAGAVGVAVGAPAVVAAAAAAAQQWILEQCWFPHSPPGKIDRAMSLGCQN